MQIKLNGENEHLLSGLKKLQKELDFEITDDASIQVSCKKIVETPHIKIEFKDGQGTIEYENPNHFYRAFGILLEKLQKGETNFSVEETAQFQTVGPMFDFSRNAVFREDSFYEMIRKLALMGFDSAMLYMEDTYEVKGE